MVMILLDAGADVNAQGGEYGNALQAASGRGDEKVVQMLFGAGADANAQGGEYGNALYAASRRGHEKVVQILFGAGADVNVSPPAYLPCPALRRTSYLKPKTTEDHFASYRGHFGEQLAMTPQPAHRRYPGRKRTSPITLAGQPESDRL